MAREGGKHDSMREGPGRMERGAGTRSRLPGTSAPKWDAAAPKTRLPRDHIAGPTKLGSFNPPSCRTTTFYSGSSLAPPRPPSVAPQGGGLDSHLRRMFTPSSAHAQLAAHLPPAARPQVCLRVLAFFCASARTLQSCLHTPATQHSLKGVCF